MGIRTVARIANVSIATVSRVINRRDTVSPKVAERVRRIVTELDYSPNVQARSLRSGRSRILGVIIPEITNPFFPELIQGFEEAALDYGYEIAVGSTYSDPNRISRCVRRILELNVDGVAVMNFGMHELLLEHLAQRNIPLVFIDFGPDHTKLRPLNIDYHRGIRQAVQHLAVLGHRNIGFLTGPKCLHSAMSCAAAFSGSVRECGIRINSRWALETDQTLEGGIAAMEALLAGQDLPTAIICSSDMIAIGVLHALNRAGLQVPDDFSVIGFDNIPLACTAIPPLTTIELPRLVLARASVAALRAQIEGLEITQQRRVYYIPTNLIVRNSTGFPRGTMGQLHTSPITRHT